MKIAFVSFAISRLGCGVFNTEVRLAQSLSVLPHASVEVLGIEDDFTESDRSAWAPVRSQAFPVIGPYSFGFSPSLLKALNGIQVDIAHVHCLWTFLSVATLNWSRRHRKPYIVSPHGMLDPWALNNSRWKKTLAALLYEKNHLRKAACLHALCDAEAEALRGYGLHNPICKVPIGIDVPLPATDPPPCHWPQTISPSSKILLYFGRLHPKKGLVSLIHAWSLARQRGGKLAQEWVLAIAGRPQCGHREHLEQLTHDLDITESVRFLGEQTEAMKTSAYYHCDAFVLPSLSEGLPMVVLEAWAHGKPVIMTPHCNLPEGFARGAAFKILPNAQNISQALLRLFEMSLPERKTMGYNGKLLVEECFTWPKVASQFYAVYSWILGGGPRPDCILLA